MRVFIAVLLLGVAGPLAAQEPVRVTNVPLLVEPDDIGTGALRSAQARLGNGSQTIQFSEPVNLLDISLSPLPPITRRISGVCKVTLLINDVPLKIATYRVAAKLEFSTEEPPPPEDEGAPEGLATTITLTLYDARGRIPTGPLFHVSPNDVISIETIPSRKKLDCDADFVVLAEALDPPVPTDGL